jgi:hypothetical protein
MCQKTTAFWQLDLANTCLGCRFAKRVLEFNIVPLFSKGNTCLDKRIDPKESATEVFTPFSGIYFKILIDRKPNDVP